MFLKHSQKFQVCFTVTSLWITYTLETLPIDNTRRQTDTHTRRYTIYDNRLVCMSVCYAWLTITAVTLHVNTSRVCVHKYHFEVGKPLAVGYLLSGGSGTSSRERKKYTFPIENSVVLFCR